MKIFIQALDCDMWSIIVNGPHILTHIVNNIVTLKFELDWDENDKRMAQLYTKVINVLYYTLDVVTTLNSAPLFSLLFFTILRVRGTARPYH